MPVLPSSPSSGNNNKKGNFFNSKTVAFWILIILIPALAWWQFRMNAILAFWFAYVVTRPLGASFADYFGRAQSLSGAGFGSGRVAVIVTIAIQVSLDFIQPP